MSHAPAGWTSGESADCTSLDSAIRIDGFPAVNLKIMQDVNHGPQGTVRCLDGDSPGRMPHAGGL